jgi:hypothetical protein
MTTATLTMRQPRTLRGLKKTFGPQYDRNRCGKLCTGDGVNAVWQCGHPAGKGKYGLFCGRHV